MPSNGITTSIYSFPMSHFPIFHILFGLVRREGTGSDVANERAGNGRFLQEWGRQGQVVENVGKGGRGGEVVGFIMRVMWMW